MSANSGTLKFVIFAKRLQGGGKARQGLMGRLSVGKGKVKIFGVQGQPVFPGLHAKLLLCLRQSEAFKLT